MTPWDRKITRANRERAMRSREKILELTAPPLIMRRVKPVTDKEAERRHISAMLKGGSASSSNRKPSMPKMPWDDEYKKQ